MSMTLLIPRWPVSDATVDARRSFVCLWAVYATRGTLENQLLTKRGADFGLAGRRAAFVSSQITIRANCSSALG
jgi:hypothetical protein